MRFRKLIAVVVVLSMGILSNSCTPIYASFVNAKKIKILNEKPTRPYEEIDMVTGQDEDIEDAYREIKIRAADLGADAVIINQNQNQNTGINQTVIINSGSKQFVFVGMAIKYKKE